ncbi:MAG TPA: DUF6265 family protein [Caulobacteraceae bacterium]|nr:DUF6265 family protein [Caulobacteraceae bacterium]
MIVLAAVLAASAAPDLGWLEGDWLACPAGGGSVEERWAGPSGGLMVGLNLATTANGRASFEHMRVERAADGTLAFVAVAGDAPAVRFPLSRAETGTAVFENPAHDFPRRIVYRREGDVLHAWVDDGAGGNRLNWRFERKTPGRRCP